MPYCLSLLMAVAGLFSLPNSASAQVTASSSVAPAPSGSITGTASGTTAYSQSNVPTGTPLPGNYDGAYRPQVHFSPPEGFMNANLMFVDANGTYHLYYQYNPTANVAGNQHWGHATSDDLYTWTNQPIAIFPGGPTEGVFSGSAVIDVNNTSGFFPNQTNGVVAIYTINVPESQTQHIAYSHDNGVSFVKYEGNPVIVPGGTSPTQFRDPKVIWYEPTESWVMVVAYPIDFKVGIFSSPDLKSWKAESNFTHYGITGLQYECPNMVEIRVENPAEGAPDSMYVMLISINPGAPLGGSITEYFLGNFNGTHFEAVDSTVRLTDFAKDNYAGQFFYGIPSGDDQITLNWASNWQYTNVVPTAGNELGDGFRSVMTVPRAHYIKNLTRFGPSLISYPYNIMSIVESELASNSSLGNGTVLIDYSNVKSGALYFEANITGLTSGDSLDGALNFTFSSSVSGEAVSGGTFISSGDVWLDRGRTDGFQSPYFNDKFSATGLYNEADGAWRLSGIVDRSIIEIFLNGGELSATSVFFPTQTLDTMAAWLDQANVDGTVYGNVTEGSNSTMKRDTLGVMQLV
ncbi:glycoside hydrolase family 32 protein [Plenodomus tracheiphilus IPT5]|uniref:Glycoside hydrolase family 32 protein n=1 Tax=Plenodomus tracheiphilus IPT5 TaxID=1408161 RepID=A0A6A7AP20_9PLEO|nr:glycoside hydrolase family 32 protein [Plenodomus tracheiphilus IPT5]